MTLIECTAAYVALCELSGQEWPVKTAYSIFRLKKALKEHADFYSQKEAEIVNDAAEKDEAGNIVWSDAAAGSFVIKTEMREKYLQAVAELSEIAVEGAFPALVLEGGSIKPNTLEKLAPFLAEGTI